MKNLFTKMVLVAVAAMGMLACQNEPETVVSGNDNAHKTTIEVIADLENTRSAFGNKGGDGAYASYWQGGEQVEASTSIVKKLGSYSYLDGSQSSATVNVAAGETIAKFSLSFSSSPTDDTTIYLATPGESVSVDYNGIVTSIPTTQTPLESSVDPLAHILTATYTGPYTTGSIKPEWEHAAAYAKMTLKNIENVERVVVTIDSKSYQLNADNVVGNVFWFACEANEAPSTVKVKVNTTDEKAYIKTLDLTAGNGQGLPFAKGNVAEFSVNMDGITPEEGGADEMIVDYVLDVAKNTSGYWQFSTGSHGTAPYVRIYMNSNDTADNAFKTKDYTFSQSNTNPSTGVFSINRYDIGSGTVWGSSISAGSMTISIVNNQYRIVITAGNVNPITFGWEGVPDGWDAPGTGGGEEPEPDPDPDPVQLAAPTNLSATATTNTATISWTAVANASSYNVTVGITTKNVTDTTATFDGLTPDATYEVSVVAVGDGTNYTNSPAATTTVKTLAEETGGDDPDGPIVLTSAVCFGMYYETVPLYEFRTADGNYVLKVAIHRDGDRIHKGTYTFTTSINNLVYSPGVYFAGGAYAGASTIAGSSSTNAISTGSTITVVSESGPSTTHVIEFHIVTNTNAEYDFKYEGLIVDQR